MATVFGELRVNGLPRDGALVQFWPVTAAFTPNNPPQQGDAYPAGTPLASGLTGPQHGAVGAIRLYNVPAGEGYLGFQWNGLMAWEYYNGLAAGNTPGATGLLTVTANVTGALVEGMALTYSTSVSGFTNTAPKFACYLGMFSAFTPSATGADTGELQAPRHPDDGTTSLTWNVRRLQWRCAVSGSTSGVVTIQKSVAANTGAFDPVTVGTITLLPGAYEGFSTAPFTSPTVASGDKLRVFCSGGLLPAATAWTISVLLGTS